MDARIVADDYETALLEVDKLFKLNEISDAYKDILFSILNTNLDIDILNERYVSTKFKIDRDVSENIISHLNRMARYGYIPKSTLKMLCACVRRYSSLTARCGGIDALEIIDNEAVFYSKRCNSRTFAEHKELKRRNRDLYPYLNEVTPYEIREISVPYPIYVWDVEGRRRVAGETLLNCAGLDTRPCRRAQFNAVIGLCQDHGGVSGRAFYDECAKYFRGDATYKRVYDYIRYVNQKMCEQNNRFYRTITNTKMTMPADVFIKKCTVKTDELQKIIN